MFGLQISANLTGYFAKQTDSEENKMLNFGTILEM